METPRSNHYTHTRSDGNSLACTPCQLPAGGRLRKGDFRKDTGVVAELPYQVRASPNRSFNYGPCPVTGSKAAECFLTPCCGLTTMGPIIPDASMLTWWYASVSNRNRPHRFVRVCGRHQSNGSVEECAM